MIADHIETLLAAAKRLRLGVEGPKLADELEQIAASLAPAVAGVACHRTITGDPPATWKWIDGPPSLGALDNLKVHPTWRIEYAYTHPPRTTVAESLESLRITLENYIADMAMPGEQWAALTNFLNKQFRHTAAAGVSDAKAEALAEKWRKQAKNMHDDFEHDIGATYEVCADELESLAAGGRGG